MRIGMNIDNGPAWRTDFRHSDLCTARGTWAANYNKDHYPALTEPFPAGGSQLLTTGGGYLRPGTYTLAVGGTGKLRVGQADLVSADGHKGYYDFTFPAPQGSYSITVTSSDQSTISFTVLASDANDPLHDPHLMTPGGAHGSLWHPDFLAALKPFRVLRGMQFTQVCGATWGTWANRWPATSTAPIPFPVPRDGYGYEAFFDLCNATGADPWVNLPHPCATITGPTDFPAQLGALIKAMVPADRTVYLEYSNECWNWGNPYAVETGYCQSIAPQLADPVTGKMGIGAGGAYGWLANQAFDALEAAVGTGGPRIVRVFAGCAADVWGTPPRPQDFMSYFFQAQKKFGWRVDALACAPYTDIQRTGTFAPKVLASLASVDMDSAIQVLTDGLAAGIPWIDAPLRGWRAAADDLGVPLYYYEMAPASPWLWQHKELQPLLVAAEADPRMGAVMRQYLATIGPYAEFGCYYGFAQRGVWGVAQTLDDIVSGQSQRYKALMDYKRCWDDLPRPVPAPTPAPTAA